MSKPMDRMNGTVEKAARRALAMLAIGLAGAFAATVHAAYVGIASSPRGIYFEPADTKTDRSKDTRIAVRFWVELHPRDEQATRTVSAEHVFHNYDRTRFRVAANTDCYVYVAYHGSSGARALLFPSVPAGRDNRLQRHEPKVIPSTRGYFTFDDHPGQEHVVVVVSPERVAALERIAAARVGDNATTRSLTLTPEENRIWSDLQKQWTGKAMGASTKDVVHEAEESGPQVGSYYAQTVAFTQPVLINITLKHEP